MRPRILTQTRFVRPTVGWIWPEGSSGKLKPGPDGALLAAGPSAQAWAQGPGVHTRNGDSIELHFEPTQRGKGALRFGFDGGFESAMVTLDFARGRVRLDTTEWTRRQPVASARLDVPERSTHVLRIDKTAGAGDLVRMADLAVSLDGQRILTAQGLDLLPEQGVMLDATGVAVRLKRFVHRGEPSGVAEYLHVGAWQMLNRPSIAENVESLQRGLRQAAQQGVELLVTPETSLTGLFPRHAMTSVPGPIETAERKLRRFIRELKGAPYVVVGLPQWRQMGNHERAKTRYNVSRVYDPDGHVVDTFAKIHSCEPEFHHGRMYQEFDVHGVPICMHICHDGRYPDVWTVPVMFGSRLILHPANGGTISGSVAAVESRATRETTTSHAFYVNVNGGGGSYIVGPDKYDNVLAISPECHRDNAAYPIVGPPVESLNHAKLRIHDAFGYWPVRTFRRSEQVARAYLDLYHAMGGQRDTE